VHFSTPPAFNFSAFNCTGVPNGSCAFGQAAGDAANNTYACVRTVAGTLAQADSLLCAFFVDLAHWLSAAAASDVTAGQPYWYELYDMVEDKWQLTAATVFTAT
jgi:hypothetical protein